MSLAFTLLALMSPIADVSARKILQAMAPQCTLLRDSLGLFGGGDLPQLLAAGEAGDLVAERDGRTVNLADLLLVSEPVPEDEKLTFFIPVGPDAQETFSALGLGDECMLGEVVKNHVAWEYRPVLSAPGSLDSLDGKTALNTVLNSTAMFVSSAATGQRVMINAALKIETCVGVVHLVNDVLVPGGDICNRLGGENRAAEADMPVTGNLVVDVTNGEAGLTLEDYYSVYDGKEYVPGGEGSNQLLVIKDLEGESVVESLVECAKQCSAMAQCNVVSFYKTTFPGGSNCWPKMASFTVDANSCSLPADATDVEDAVLMMLADTTCPSQAGRLAAQQAPPQLLVESSGNKTAADPLRPDLPAMDKYTLFLQKEYLPDATKLLQVEDIDGEEKVATVEECASLCSSIPDCNLAAYYMQGTPLPAGVNCWLKKADFVASELTSCALPDDAEDVTNSVLLMLEDATCPEPPEMIANPFNITGPTAMNPITGGPDSSLVDTKDLAEDDTDAEADAAAAAADAAAAAAAAASARQAAAAASSNPTGASTLRSAAGSVHSTLMISVVVAAAAFLI